MIGLTLGRLRPDGWTIRRRLRSLQREGGPCHSRHHVNQRYQLLDGSKARPGGSVPSAVLDFPASLIIVPPVNVEADAVMAADGGVLPWQPPAL